MMPLMSVRETQRRYSSLMKDVATDDFYKKDLTNRVNCYYCHTCKRVTKTKDIDPGVTSFFFTCDYCGKDAHSTFYNDVAPTQIHTHEWYRPSIKEVLKLRNKPSTLEHVLKGGLLSRKVEMERKVSNG